MSDENLSSNSISCIENNIPFDAEIISVDDFPSSDIKKDTVTVRDICFISRLHDGLDNAIQNSNTQQVIALNELIIEIENKFGKNPNNDQCITVLKELVSKKEAAYDKANKAGKDDLLFSLQQQLTTLKYYILRFAC